VSQSSIVYTSLLSSADGTFQIRADAVVKAYLDEAIGMLLDLAGEGSGTTASAVEAVVITPCLGQGGRWRYCEAEWWHVHTYTEGSMPW